MAETERKPLEVKVPKIPAEAIQFAEAVAALAEQNGLREVEMDVRLNCGYGSKYWTDHELERETQQNMHISFSCIDGRGRPRRRLEFTVKSETRVPILWEPNSDG